jgi:APA family basic amino acid/polyamine antiporter
LTTTTSTAETSPSSREFVKALTLTDATMLVAGSMIGSGIFIVSADISRTVSSPFWLLMAWVVSGVVTILGALAYGELAAMYPKAGGQYVFLRESMGSLMGFLYGWTLFVVIQTGTIAAVAVAFGKYLGVLWPAISPDRFAWFPQMDFATAGDPVQLGLSPQRLIALISIWVLTWINLRGIKEGKWVQTTLTVVKTGALAALILLGLTLGRHADAIAANFSNGNFNSTAFTPAFVIAFGSALVGSLFSSDAWNNVTFAAAEVHSPQRNLPSAALIAQSVWTSLLCLTGTYGQLLNYVIFAALIFYALTTIGLFRLRKLRPDAERPYRVVGYPVLPALYIILALAIAVILLIADQTRAQSLWGLVIVLLGVPVFFIWRKVESEPAR